MTAFISIGILATRTKSQIASIAVVYEKKYVTPLLQQVVSDMTTFMGKLITGKETGLCKLLTYRILPQSERGDYIFDPVSGYSFIKNSLEL